MPRWTADQIPEQSGRLAVVTGATSGLGQLTALELARHGAHVVLAVRNHAAGLIEAERIRDQIPGARVDARELDLASLASVRAFAAQLTAAEAAIDVMVNNAGVMRTPHRTTVDGFELQLGTNYLGHFALTGLLLGALTAAPAARVVTLSSTEHKPGRINFADLQLEHGYAPRAAYQQSKLASTIFGIELDRRLRAAGSPVISVLAHPGVSRTNLSNSGPVGRQALIARLGTALLAQPARRGVLPQLYAATAPGVHSGDFFGPSGFGETRGHVTTVHAAPQATDPDTAGRLWQMSEQLTGVTFVVGPSVAQATPAGQNPVPHRPDTR
jgi:NAD(P)-dependent dehydrogenase (short-subunit alcohol dehydrogenase family)